MIRKEDLINFSGDLEENFTGETIWVKGEINEIGGTPVIYLDREEWIGEYELDTSE